MVRIDRRSGIIRFHYIAGGFMRRLFALVVPLLGLRGRGALARGSARPARAVPSSSAIVDKLPPPPPGGKPRSLTRGRVTIEGPPTIDMRIQFEIDSPPLAF